MSKSSPIPTDPKTKKDVEIEMFFIGLEILGKKKKLRFLLYLASLQTSKEQNQEKKANEL
jgi:hypothetical protein